MRFVDKVAIITGATTGIGKAARELLSREGCMVYGFDIKQFKNNKNEKFVKCDVRNYEEVTRSVDYVVEKERKVDFLFANAGIYLYASIENTSPEQLENVLAVNIKGVFYVIKAVLPLMRRQKGGGIVITGSDQSLIGKANSSAYGLTKGAIAQLTKSLAIDYVKYNIRVNCVCPGTIDTPLYRNIVKTISETFDVAKKELYEAVKSAQPIHRVGSPSEVARLVAFLLSDECEFMTGSLISVDGGYTCQ